MFFKSYADLAKDIELWSSKLPEFSAIIGVPRSGILPASLLALKRNIPLLDLSAFTVGAGFPLAYNRPLRRGGTRIEPVEGNIRILVIDDTTYTGSTLAQLKEELRHKFSGVEFQYAAYMAGTPGIQHCDHVMYATENVPQLVEWSTLHIPFNKYTMTDLDGVICEDWTLGDEDLHKEQYSRFLENAAVLIRPSYPVRAIVTNRLEKNRGLTEAWLKKHGIKYEMLIMCPARDAYDRQVRYGLAGFKRLTYEEDDPSQLFIESDTIQAMGISYSNKPVLDWQYKKLLNGLDTTSVTQSFQATNGVTVNLPNKHEYKGPVVSM
jgi:hypoxanthine phosphoribosyltransferase